MGVYGVCKGCVRGIRVCKGGVRRVYIEYYHWYTSLNNLITSLNNLLTYLPSRRLLDKSIVLISFIVKPHVSGTLPVSPGLSVRISCWRYGKVPLEQYE